MAKRPAPVPPDQIDTTRNDKEYWEDILRREGLSMSRGLHPNVYVGTSKNVEDIIEGAPVQIQGHSGTVQPPKSSQ